MKYTFPYISKCTREFVFNFLYTEQNNLCKLYIRPNQFIILKCKKKIHPSILDDFDQIIRKHVKCLIYKRTIKMAYFKGVVDKNAPTDGKILELCLFKNRLVYTALTPNLTYVIKNIQKIHNPYLSEILINNKYCFTLMTNYKQLPFEKLLLMVNNNDNHRSRNKTNLDVSRNKTNLDARKCAYLNRQPVRIIYTSTLTNTIYKDLSNIFQSLGFTNVVYSLMKNQIYASDKFGNMLLIHFNDDILSSSTESSDVEN